MSLFSLSRLSILVALLVFSATTGGAPTEVVPEPAPESTSTAPANPAPDSASALDPAPLTELPLLLDSPILAEPTVLFAPDAAPFTPHSLSDPTLNFEPTEGDPSTLLPPWRFNLGVTVSVLHDDNIFIARRNEVQDWIFLISPYVELAWGDYRDQKETFASFRYTAEGRHYEENDYLDKVDHHAELDLQLKLAKTLLTLRLEYESLSTVDIDIGSFSNRQIFNGFFSAEYDLSNKTSLEVDLFGSYADYESGLDSDSATVNVLVNTQLTPKFRLGIGAAGGFLEQENSSAQDYVQLILRGRYLPTEKITVRGQIGADYRQFESQEKFNVLGRLGVAYKPRETTQLSFDFTRSIIASASEPGRNYVATSIILQARQLLFQRVQLSLSGGYTNADYQEASFGGGSDRNDDILFATPRVSFAVKNWLDVAFFYTYRENESSGSNNSFKSNIVGMEITGKF